MRNSAGIFLPQPLSLRVSAPPREPNTRRGFVPSCEPKAGNLRPMKPDIQHNPDVLTCLANLSSDEVFTPPKLANEMLDMLPASLWRDKNATFLDPFTKSGVFLREIAKRLNAGLEQEIPDPQERVNHILGQQIFGIAITELTALISRRSLYCNKSANSQYSVATCFEDVPGNIWFERIEHTWGETKCIFCGAPKAILDRGDDAENYAYAFIHTHDINTRITELFKRNMKFDVIIGNPPYQMKGGAGGTSDSSIYHLFVEQAKKLNPRYLSMVVPSRWLAGGRGMDDFRKEMLNSGQIIRLVDFPVSREIFPNVEVKGGISYFLWSEAHNGSCEVTVIRGDERTSSERKLNEFDIFVRDSRAVEILRKVMKQNEPSIIDLLTADTPFGIATNFDGFRKTKKAGDVALYYVKSGKRGIGFLPQVEISKNAHLIDKWKVFVPEAGSDGGQKIPDSVLGKPWLGDPPSACTQSFLAFFANTEDEAKSIESYFRTKFFRHLVSLRKLTQHALRSTYTWVPQQTWDRNWTDAMLYEKYQLTPEEIDYIETVIRPMEPTDA
jgi:site-specific DNA-methyltransferase (adenine-specific)